ncbi:MAG: hypothetical protein ACP5OG_04925 [Candidatus Nanoarchaeia archaeon]
MNEIEKECKKQSDNMMAAYRIIAKETGLPLEECAKNSYCVVKKSLDADLFGKIGIYQTTKNRIDYFNFKDKTIGFDNINNEIYWAINPILVLKEREKAQSLF